MGIFAKKEKKFTTQAFGTEKEKKKEKQLFTSMAFGSKKSSGASKEEKRLAQIKDLTAKVKTERRVAGQKATIKKLKSERFKRAFGGAGFKIAKIQNKLFKQGGRELASLIKKQVRARSTTKVRRFTRARQSSPGITIRIGGNTAPRRKPVKRRVKRRRSKGFSLTL